MTSNVGNDIQATNMLAHDNNAIPIPSKPSTPNWCDMVEEDEKVQNITKEYKYHPIKSTINTDNKKTIDSDRWRRSG